MCSIDSRRIWMAGLLLVVAVACGSTGAWAQTISGVIAGVVKDPQGVALPAVSVTVTNLATGRSYAGSTDDAGYYRISEVPPGVYEVQAELGGFQTEKHTQVRVHVNRVTQEEFTLQIPPKVEVLEVTSRAPMNDVTSATLSLSFPDRQVTELPILSRDINNLALLSPGVSSVRTFSFASTLVPFAVNGSRGRDNNFIIDSVDNNEPLFGGAATQFTNTDIFTEYTILTHQMKAEFGRNSGATVNIITKSGSNRLHGSLFWFTSQDELNARSQVEETAFLEQPTQFYENQIGATLGGALKKDKTFYFLSYQWVQSRTNLSNVLPVLSNLPTGAGLATLAGLAQTPALQAFLGLSSVSQIPIGSFPCFGEPPPTNFNATNPCRVLSAPVSVDTDGDLSLDTPVDFNVFLVPDGNLFDVRDHQFSLRLDHRIGATDDFYGRFLFDDIRRPAVPLAPAGDAACSDQGLLPDWRLFNLSRTQSLLLNERHYWVNTLNEFRFSFTRISTQIGAFALPETVREGQAAATIAEFFGGFDPFQQLFVAAGQRITLGRDSRPGRTNSNIYQIQDNLTLNRGRHSLKAGVNIVRTQSNIRSVPSDLGQYFFGVEGASFGFSDFINEPTTAPTRALAAFQRFPNVLSDSSGNITGQGQDVLPLRGFDQFYFFQDDIRLRPNLTVSLGVRYERYSQPINRIRRLNPRGPQVSADNNNLAPRLGFAWAPWGRTTVRGGYSLFYNPMVLNIPLLIWQSGPVSPFVVTDALFFSLAQPSGVFPQAPMAVSDVDVSVSGCSNFLLRASPGTVPLINCSNQNTVASNLKNPYVQQFSFGVQQALLSDLLLELNYVGSIGTQLYQRADENPFGGWDLACAAVVRGLTGAPVGFCLNARDNDTRGGVTRVTNGARSNYHSLQASLNRRLTRTRAGDLTFTAAYTWSHMIDNASEIFGPGVRLLPGAIDEVVREADALESVEAITPLAADPNNTLRGERGDSSFDRRHHFAASFLWEPLPQKGFWLGGWQINGILSAQSGQPFTPVNTVPFGRCRDYNGDGRLTNDRPAVGDPSAPATSVALMVDAVCINPALGYINLAGTLIDPATARFVQVPLGATPGAAFTFTDPTSGELRSFVAGSVGRNILTGPNLVNFDLAIFKNFRWGEGKTIQFRWEIYNLFNRSNPGNAIGNVFATDAQAAPAFAFAPRATAAAVTGVIPENALDALDAFGERLFLSTSSMNTGNRRMQIGIKFIF